MAVQINQTTVVVPANTPKTALSVATISLPLLQIESIDLEVPPGPVGLMGFYIALSGQQWIPWNAGEFIVWDNYRDSCDLQNQLIGVPWEVHAYNLDAANSHEIVVRFHLNDTPVPITVAPSVTIVSTPAPQPVSVL